MRNKSKRLFITLAIELALTLTLFWSLGSLLPSTHAAGPHYVAPGANCGGASPCYDSVQAAVDAASPGDVIKVAAGDYTGVQTRNGIEQVVYISKTVTVRGGYTITDWDTSDPVANPTTLNAEGLGRVLVISGTITPTVEGLRITGGDATRQGGISGEDAGGGVYVHMATVTISNCVVVDNVASTNDVGYGGGLYLFVVGSDAKLEGNVVEDNTASTADSGTGGGVLLRYSDATLRDNVVEDNTASTEYNGLGGGLMLYNGAATLEGNTVISNTASAVGWWVGGEIQGKGGGIYLSGLYGTNASTLVGNTVQGNVASTGHEGYGGGLYISGSADATLEGNTVQGNIASRDYEGDGGGLYLLGSDATFNGNTVQDNVASTGEDPVDSGDGGGLYLAGSDGTLEGNTVQGNTASTTGLGRGGGVYLENSDASLSDNVVQGNTASTAADKRARGGGLYLRTSDATLEDNTVISNTAGIAYYGSGGGLYLHSGDVTLEGNTIRGNIASTTPVYGGGFGGGIDIVGGNATLVDNTIINNIGSTTNSGYGGGLHLSGSDVTLSGNVVQGNIGSTESHGSGGGLYLYGDNYFAYTATLEGNTFINNIASTDSSGSGGGLYLDLNCSTSGGTAMLEGNTIVSNTATSSQGDTGEGGGLKIRGCAPFTMTNNLVAGNPANTEGSGLWLDGTASALSLGRLLHNTIADNGAREGVYVDDDMTLTFINTIIAGHSVGITATTGSTVTLDHTLWHANGTDVGGDVTHSTGVYGDPAFANPTAWDYHLTSGSAAIDQGVNVGTSVDIDGDSRPDGCLFDIGADEFITGVECKHIYLPLVLRNQ